MIKQPHLNQRISIVQNILKPVYAQLSIDVFPVFFNCMPADK